LECRIDGAEKILFLAGTRRCSQYFLEAYTARRTGFMSFSFSSLLIRLMRYSRLSAAERREWMKMAFYSQLVALGLRVSFIQYDLIVLQKR